MGRQNLDSLIEGRKLCGMYTVLVINFIDYRDNETVHPGKAVLQWGSRANPK